MTEPSGPRVAVIGEALIDIIRERGGYEERPGGSPANVALTLARLGRPVTFHGCAGDDAHGRILRDWLEHDGVAVSTWPIARTSTAVANIGVDGAASYDFDIAWVLPERVDIPEAQIVHTGSLATLIDPGAERLVSALEQRAAGSLLSFDPNIRPTLVTDPELVRSRTAEVMSLSDVVKASDEDIAWLREVDVDDEQALLASARDILELGPALVIVTRGAAGAFAVTAQGTLASIGAPPVTVVDTVGAGDTFTGAMLDGLLHLDAVGHDRGPGALDRPELENLLRWAAAAAAVTVSRRGADPPRSGELGRGPEATGRRSRR